MFCIFFVHRSLKVKPWLQDRFFPGLLKHYSTITNNCRSNGCLILTSFAVCKLICLSFSLEHNHWMLIQPLRLYFPQLLNWCSMVTYINLSLQVEKHLQLLELSILVLRAFRNFSSVRRKSLSQCIQRAYFLSFYVFDLCIHLHNVAPKSICNFVGKLQRYLLLYNEINWHAFNHGVPRRLLS